ncbi:unnamed protein product [Amoebophrya sp. A120]|nr:unnamed protein product [Amoebophrya sp. A120]|eukprot:GSA120T00002413001.1
MPRRSSGRTKLAKQQQIVELSTLAVASTFLFLSFCWSRHSIPKSSLSRYLERLIAESEQLSDGAVPGRNGGTTPPQSWFSVIRNASVNQYKKQAIHDSFQNAVGSISKVLAESGLADSVVAQRLLYALFKVAEGDALGFEKTAAAEAEEIKELFGDIAVPASATESVSLASPTDNSLTKPDATAGLFPLRARSFRVLGDAVLDSFVFTPCFGLAGYLFPKYSAQVEVRRYLRRYEDASLAAKVLYAQLITAKRLPQLAPSSSEGKKVKPSPDKKKKKKKDTTGVATAGLQDLAASSGGEKTMSSSDDATGFEIIEVQDSHPFDRIVVRAVLGLAGEDAENDIRSTLAPEQLQALEQFTETVLEAGKEVRRGRTTSPASGSKRKASESPLAGGAGNDDAVVLSVDAARKWGSIADFFQHCIAPTAVADQVREILLRFPLVLLARDLDQMLFIHWLCDSGNTELVRFVLSEEMLQPVVEVLQRAFSSNDKCAQNPYTDARSGTAVAGAEPGAGGLGPVFAVPSSLFEEKDVLSVDVLRKIMLNHQDWGAGNTPLHYAFDCEQDEIIDLLSSAPHVGLIDQTARNMDGRTLEKLLSERSAA